MSQVETYRIRLSRKIIYLNRFGFSILLISVFVCVAFGLFDLPVANSILEIRIAWIFSLPDWITNTYLLGIAGSLFGLILWRFRFSQKAVMVVDKIGVRIFSKTKKYNLGYQELDKIIPIENRFSFRPYQLELVQTNRQIIHVVFPSVKELEHALETICKRVPGKIVLDVFPFRSPGEE